MSCSSLLKIHQRPGCHRPYARAEESYRCRNHLDMVWGGPSACPTGGVGWSLLWGGGTWVSTWGCGITTLPQIPLNLGEEHFAGAGPGLAHARLIIHGLLNGLLNSPSPHSARLHRTWV